MSSDIRQAILDYMEKEGGYCELHDVIHDLDFSQDDVEKSLMGLWEQNAVNWIAPTIFAPKQSWDVEESFGSVTIRFDEG